MKKTIILFIIVVAVIFGNLLIGGCAATKEINEKSGAQLWGENCNRCHNAPSMDQYSKDQWGIIGTHMKIRANLTDKELIKVVDFLQGKM